jgi:aminopeptidase YwaD
VRRLAIAVLLAALTVPSSAPLHAAIDPVIETLWSSYDANASMDHVRFISQYWRLPGNAGYDASLDRVAERLTTSGVFSTRPHEEKTPDVFFETTPDVVRAWDHSIGTLAIVRPGQPDEVVLTKEKERLALCINSFSTVPGGVVAPIVDVGRGDRDEDYAGKDLKGAVVLGDAEAGQLWRRAVVTHGAIGIVSGALPAYLNADPPNSRTTPRDEWDILQWSSVPYDEARQGFGFKASPRAVARLREALRSAARTPSREPGPAGAREVSRDQARVDVRVTIASTFVNNPVRTLVAEIPGRVAPEERVILAAHVQEPGANDNASGVATLAELAYSMAAAIKAGKMPPPGRTVTFLFLTEISGSRQWLKSHPDDANRAKYMFSLDMTGEDVAKTGGSFLIERYPDPGAVWDRPWDPHSEWGRGDVRAEQLKGDLINDLHLAVCLRVADKTGWVVKTNPYEGGSDHTVFNTAGVPSLLNWHFTDRYYHTNFDTPDKTSPQEMKNVGVAVGASAWLLASANESQAGEVADLVAAAGQARIALERAEGEKIAATGKDAAAAKAREATIVAAWRKWYGEAVRSVSRLVVGPASPSFGDQLNRLAMSFDAPRSVELRLESGSVAGLGAGWGFGLNHGQGSASTPPADGVFTCGEDQQVPEIPLRRESVVLAGDSRGFAPCGNRHPTDHRELREAAVIDAALKSSDPEMRRLAVQARGRMGSADAAGDLMRLLRTDSDARVRREAAYAVATVLSGTAGEYGVIRPIEPAAILRTRVELESVYASEQNADVGATILETIGRLRYATDAGRELAEAFLIAQSTAGAANPTRLLGAVKGIEVLFRQNPKRTVSLATRQRLRELAGLSGIDDQVLRVRRLAMLSLQTARDDDTATLDRASRDDDWQVRRLAALRLDLSNAEMARIGEHLVKDPAPQVRYEFLGPLGREAQRGRTCAAVAQYFGDPETMVVLRALDVLPQGCTDAADALKRVTAFADELGRPESQPRWHVPARALTALARVSPDDARARLKGAAAHAVWQVRAAAATAATTLSDEATLVTLAGDRVPNVRDTALNGLVRLNSTAVTQAALEALKLDDYQLVRSASIALRGTPPDRRGPVNDALLQTLQRLTQPATDTSRDPRVAILERLEELLPADRAADLLPYAADFDPKVRAAAVKAYTAKGQAAPPPGAAIKQRYPLQPTAAQLSALPTTAVISMEGLGAMELELYPDQAPVTVARFAALARAGAYNGLTFHRVVPNFVIQGGSPGANEYAGTTPRYLRDELGLHPHVRGAVGISTRGRDTGDAQLFIDLVDLPRLDHDYTVFGRVRTGLDVLDRVLEGAKIESVVVK